MLRDVVGGGQGAPARSTVIQPQIPGSSRLRHPALNKLGAILCLVTKLGDLLLDTGRAASSPCLLVLGYLLPRRAVDRYSSQT